MARLIVVSNRVASPDQGVPTGGLATGVLAALSGPGGGLWFGWSGKTQIAPSLEPTEQEKDGIRFATIDLPVANFDAIATDRYGRCIIIFQVLFATTRRSSKRT